ncbi:hypothetical protein [Acinetobacter nosocomialis]|uniref:hypothetical protein n=1 Tax=Acinetobacter nosocomialis TaxID=106654 RepID=UPI0033B302FF
MIKFITVWYLIVVPFNHVNSGESMTTIQIPYATQAICEAQAVKYRVNDSFREKSRFFSSDGLINAHCQFGQVPVYVGEKK